MRARKPFPLVGVVAAAIASYGLFQDVPMVATLAAVVFALIGIIGFWVYQKRQSRA